MKFLPLIFALGTWALVEWFIIQPYYLLWALGSLALLNIVLARWLARQEKKQWWKFALLPLLGSGIVSAYLSLLTSSAFVQIVTVLLVIFIFIYWRLVYLYLVKSSRYVAFSLENLSFYVNFVLIFLLGSVAYGLRLFLSASPWWLGLLIAVVTALAIYQLFWVSKRPTATWPYWFTVWLLLLQAFYIFMLLPFDYTLLGFFWASFYYIISSLLNEKLGGKLSKSKIKLYLILIGVSWLLLLITARWL